MSLSSKTPAEIITVTFDFTNLCGELSAPPVITCLVASGQVDTNHQAMIYGAPQISGTKVLQHIMGGVEGTTYRLECTADDVDGNHWAVSDLLRIQTP